MAPQIIEKWFPCIKENDIYIVQVWFKATPKRWARQREDNTAIGFGGTQTSIDYLLSWKTSFTPDDARLFDTYEEARESLYSQLMAKREAAKRKVVEVGQMLDMFNKVHYEKQD